MHVPLEYITLHSLSQVCNYTMAHQTAIYLIQLCRQQTLSLSTVTSPVQSLSFDAPFVAECYWAMQRSLTYPPYKTIRGDGKGRVYREPILNTVPALKLYFYHHYIYYPSTPCRLTPLSLWSLLLPSIVERTHKPVHYLLPTTVLDAVRVSARGYF